LARSLLIPALGPAGEVALRNSCTHRSF